MPSSLMASSLRPLGRLLVPGLLVLALGACAKVTPFDYVPVDEIPPGPGLLTGEDGEFVIFGR